MDCVSHETPSPAKAVVHDTQHASCSGSRSARCDDVGCAIVETVRPVETCSDRVAERSRRCAPSQGSETPTNIPPSEDDTAVVPSQLAPPLTETARHAQREMGNGVARSGRRQVYAVLPAHVNDRALHLICRHCKAVLGTTDRIAYRAAPVGPGATSGPRRSSSSPSCLHGQASRAEPGGVSAPCCSWR